MLLSVFCDAELCTQILEAQASEADKRDVLSLRNSLLLFKALKKERCAECYISLQAFDHYAVNYKHFLRDSDRKPLKP